MNAYENRHLSFARLHFLDSRLRGNDRYKHIERSVIPAKAGIQGILEMPCKIKMIPKSVNYFLATMKIARKYIIQYE